MILQSTVSRLGALLFTAHGTGRLISRVSLCHSMIGPNKSSDGADEAANQAPNGPNKLSDGADQPAITRNQSQ